MDFKIAGVSLYYIISWFFIYSFFGWIWESAYVSIKKGTPVNRGFISGPLCTIYGVGAVAVYLILKPFQENLLILYLGGVVTATFLEYVTGWLMERIFHTRWWDYSQKKYNLQGYICLGSSIAWGFFTVLLFKVLHPFVSWLTGLYPVFAGRIALSVVSLLYLADFAASAWAAFSLSKAFEKAEDMLEELTVYLYRSRIYGTKEEIRERLEAARKHVRQQEVLERLNGKKQEFLERFEELVRETPVLERETYLKKKQELEQKLNEFNRKYLDIRRRQNAVKKRMVRAYPGLKEQFQKYREKHLKRRTKKS